MNLHDTDIINLGGERFRLIDGRWHWYINSTRWAGEGDETLCAALHEIVRLRELVCIVVDEQNVAPDPDDADRVVVSLHRDDYNLMHPAVNT